jgi:hypothetical protein
VGTATVIIVAIVVVVAVVGGVFLLRRSGRASGDVSTEARAPRPEPPPMRGLEDALNQVTDRSGTTMAARLDAEGAHVDDLRDLDDTGPLLRRALDHVTPREPLSETGAVAATEPAVVDEPDGVDEPGDNEPGPRTS